MLRCKVLSVLLIFSGGIGLIQTKQSCEDQGLEVYGEYIFIYIYIQGYF